MTVNGTCYISDSYHFMWTAHIILKSCIKIYSRQHIYKKRCLSNDESNGLRETEFCDSYLGFLIMYIYLRQHNSLRLTTVMTKCRTSVSILLCNRNNVKYTKLTSLGKKQHTKIATGKTEFCMYISKTLPRSQSVCSLKVAD